MRSDLFTLVLAVFSYPTTHIRQHFPDIYWVKCRTRLCLNADMLSVLPWATTAPYPSGLDGASLRLLGNVQPRIDVSRVLDLQYPSSHQNNFISHTLLLQRYTETALLTLGSFR